MVDRVGVGDQGVAHPGQVQQPVPGGVIAGEPGDLQRDDDAYLAQRDLGDQVLKPVTVPGDRPRDSLVGVDQPDRAVRPAEPGCPAGQVVLAQRRFGVAFYLGQR